MTLAGLERLRTLERIHKEIERERTGGQRELGERMRLPRTTLQKCIDSLRLLGAVIEFDRSKKTYYYTNGFSLKIEISYDESDSNRE